MKYFVRFDTKVARVVALLPKSLHRPFEILGLVTPPLSWAGLLFLIMLLQQPAGRPAFIAALLLMPLASLVKFAFRRQRPPTIYAGNMRIKSYSFPSSHSYSSALACVLLAGVMHIPIIAIILPLIAIVIGVSRIFVGAHYPSDVIAGLCLGTLAAIGALQWS